MSLGLSPGLLTQPEPQAKTAGATEHCSGIAVAPQAQLQVEGKGSAGRFPQPLRGGHDSEGQVLHWVASGVLG
jgi:hypothetical protein